MRRFVLALALVATVVAAAGCVTSSQKTFLVNHAEKIDSYVDAADQGPIALAEGAIRLDTGMLPARKTVLLEQLQRLRQRGADLKADAAAIREVWGE